MKMEEETRDALLPGGWLRSGDVATIDADHEPNVSSLSVLLVMR